MSEFEARLRAELADIAAGVSVAISGSPNGRRSKRPFVVVVSGLLVFALAGGIAWTRLDATDHGTKLLTLEAVVQATSTAGTARMSFERADAGPGTGDADFLDERYRFHEKVTDSELKIVAETLNVILVGSHVFVSVRARQWCELTDPSASKEPLGFDPAAVLGSLRPPATLRRLGTDTIRGVATTHYQILHSRMWNDLWVDGHDQLRRIASYLSQPASSETIDFFDYGARLAPITAPPVATSCIS